MLSFQGQLAAIATFEATTPDAPKTNFYAISDADAAQKIIDEKGISPQMVEFAQKGIRKGNGAPRGVPLYGDLAVKLKVVSPQTKDDLMAAQAAERTILAFEGKTSDAITQGFEQHAASGKMFARPFIGGKWNPKHTAQAQATHHLADLVAGFIATQGGKEKVAPEVQAANETLLGLGIHCYELAQAKLDKICPAASKAIGVITTDLKDKTPGKFDLKTSLDIVKKGMGAISDHYKSEQPAFSAALDEIATERLGQALGVAARSASPAAGRS